MKRINYDKPLTVDFLESKVSDEDFNEGILEVPARRMDRLLKREETKISIKRPLEPLKNNGRTMLPGLSTTINSRSTS